MASARLEEMVEGIHRAARRGGNSKAHAEKMRDTHLRQLFAADPARGERMTADAAGIFFDYSKNRVTDETIQLLIRLAEEADLAGPYRGHVSRRKDQHHGEARSSARSAAGAERCVDCCGRQRTLFPRSTPFSKRWQHFSNKIRSGEWTGHSGKRIRNIVKHRHRRLRPGPGNGL